MAFIGKFKRLLILQTLPKYFNSKVNNRDDKLTGGGKIWYF